MFEEIILARGTAQYYAMEALFRHLPPRAPSHARRNRPSQQRLRRLLAWLVESSQATARRLHAKEIGHV